MYGLCDPPSRPAIVAISAMSAIDQPAKKSSELRLRTIRSPGRARTSGTLSRPRPVAARIRARFGSLQLCSA